MYEIASTIPAGFRRPHASRRRAAIQAADASSIIANNRAYSLSGLLVSAAVLSKECAMQDSLTKHAAQLARLAIIVRIGLESADAAIPGINDLPC